MTIPKVKAGGWASGARLKRSEITQLDKNISYALDSGTDTTTPHDTCESDNTFKNASVFGKDDHGSFTIEDPTSISIGDGYIGIDSPIDTVGQLGYVEVALQSSGLQSLTAAEYLTAHTIKLTGKILDYVTLVFPPDQGYTKQIDCDFTTGNGYFDGYYVSLSLGVGSLGYGDTVKVYPNTTTVVYSDGFGLYEVIEKGSHYTLVDQIYIKNNPTPINTPYPGMIQPKLLYSSYLGGFGYESYVVTPASEYPTIRLGKYGISDLGFNDLRVKGEAVFLDGREGDKFEIFFQCGVQRTGGSANTLTFIAPLVSYGEGWLYTYYDNFKEPRNKVQQVLMAGAINASDGDFVQGSSTTIFTAPIDGCYQFNLYAYALLLTTFYQNPVTGFGPVIFRVKQWRK